VVVLAAAACGEPAVSVDIPAREGEERIADLAGIFGDRTTALEDRLAQIAEDGPDVVALTYETGEASCGEAYRAAQEFIEAWKADVALVAVARPGDFTSTDETRERCVGVQPRDAETLSGGVREQIAEQVVPPRAADNDWYGAFLAAADAVAEQ
jgi:hypothetical protein